MKGDKLILFNDLMSGGQIFVGQMVTIFVNKVTYPEPFRKNNPSDVDLSNPECDASRFIFTMKMALRIVIMTFYSHQKIIKKANILHASALTPKLNRFVTIFDGEIF